MKKVFLISLTVLAIGLFLTQTGFTYQTWTNGGSGGCKTCHPQGTLGTATPPQLHGVSAHTANCANCHNGAPSVGTVSPSACIVCHPAGGPELCPLINAQAAHNSTCLTCHSSCAPSTTTTTPANTTTTIPANTTTTTPANTTTSVQPTTTTITQENDTDGDGVPDAEDKCPESNLDETIIIGKCDSGVINQRFEDGCTMSDLIAGCSIGAKNHGKFVSCVSHLTNDWKAAGLISGEEKGAIQRCVAKDKKSKKDNGDDAGTGKGKGKGGKGEGGKGHDEDDDKDND